MFLYADFVGCYENPCRQPCLEHTSPAFFFAKTHAIENLQKHPL